MAALGHQLPVISLATNRQLAARCGQCCDLLGVTRHSLGIEEGYDQPNKEHDSYQQIATDC
jgi:hypothetical protein